MNLFNRNEKPGDGPQASQAPPSRPAQSTADPPAAVKAEAVKPPEPVKPPAAIQPIPTATRTGANMPSVISKALKITGELESTEDIQIDGQIEGDVRGVGVKIGQNARVKGTVYGDEVELAGTIDGRIESKRVILAGTARMTGDISHQDIKIESGAYINGSLKPEMGKPDAKVENKPAVKPAASASVVSSSAPKENATAVAHH
jgi:cytoskeletal protein CcmA (bactofilin family)